MAEARTEPMQRVVEMIYARSSMCFSTHRMANLENRLRERREALGVGLDEYAELLAADGEELDRLIERVSTKETHFFRIPEQFTTLREVVLPRIEEEMLDRVYAALGQGSMERLKLRVWSAGCSTGCEPYSVAMTLLAGLRHPRAWQLEILATDLSGPALAEARRGLYRPEALREAAPEVKLRHFSSREGGEFEVAVPVREMVDFRLFNLRELLDRGPGSFNLVGGNGERESRDLYNLDLIFCRNVMIYFDFPAQQALVDRLYDCLRPGGWLFTGDAELLHVYRHRFENVEAFGNCVYRKPGGER